MDKLVYILILNYASPDDTIECVDSVLKSTYSNYKIVIVDNASPDNSRNIIISYLKIKITEGNLDNLYFCNSHDFELEKFSGKYCFIQSNINGGFAYGNNLFLKHMVEIDALIWLLNPDIIVSRSLLQSLVMNAAKNPETTAISNTIRSYKNNKLLHYGCNKINFWTGTINEIRKVTQIKFADYLYGGSIITHLSNFKRYGLLPEKYFLYWEETDWCYAAKKKGLKFEICVDDYCLDKIGGSVGRGYLSEYYYSLNGLRFIKKFDKYKLGFVLWFYLFRIFKRLCMKDLSRASAIKNAIIFFIFKK